MLDKEQIVVHGLAETNARVNNDLFSRHTRLASKMNPFFEKSYYFGEQRSILRFELHGPRGSLHVHENYWYL